MGREGRGRGMGDGKVKGGCAISFLVYRYKKGINESE